jgi:hypothetical protein
MEFSIAAVNAYLDFTDYVDPVKHFIDEVYTTRLDKTRNRKANLQVMKGEVSLQDSILGVGDTTEGFFTLIENTQAFDDPYSLEESYLTF